MLNNNYRNKHLQWQKKTASGRGGLHQPILAMSSIFKLSSPSLNGLGDEMPQWERTGQWGFPRGSEVSPEAVRSPSSCNLRPWVGTVHNFFLTTGSQAYVCPGSCCGEVRKCLINQQAFLLIFTNYMQQPHSPCPLGPSIWRGSTRSPHTQY